MTRSAGPRAALGALVLLFGAALPGAPAASQPVPIEASGDYAHTASGMILPPSVAGFRRVGVYRYDAAARDVSANYHLDLASGRVLASAYVYPMPPAGGATREDACRQEFALRQGELTGVRRGARLLAEGAAAPPKGFAGIPGYRAAYGIEGSIGGQPRLLRTELHVFCFVAERWIIKYRFTGPEAPDTARAIETFATSLRWTLRSGR